MSDHPYLNRTHSLAALRTGCSSGVAVLTDRADDPVMPWPAARLPLRLRTPMGRPAGARRW